MSEKPSAVLDPSQATFLEIVLTVFLFLLFPGQLRYWVYNSKKQTTSSTTKKPTIFSAYTKIKSTRKFFGLLKKSCHISRLWVLSTVLNSESDSSPSVPMERKACFESYHWRACKHCLAQSCTVSFVYLIHEKKKHIEMCTLQEVILIFRILFPQNH